MIEYPAGDDPGNSKIFLLRQIPGVSAIVPLFRANYWYAGGTKASWAGEH